VTAIYGVIKLHCEALGTWLSTPHSHIIGSPWGAHTTGVCRGKRAHSASLCDLKHHRTHETGPELSSLSSGARVSRGPWPQRWR
jgi:hypothetical protein